MIDCRDVLTLSASSISIDEDKIQNDSNELSDGQISQPVDFLKELCHNKDFGVIADIIFKKLSDQDIVKMCCVNKIWYNAIINNRVANEKRKKHCDFMRVLRGEVGLENWPIKVIPVKTRSTKPLQQISSLDNKIEVAPIFHLETYSSYDRCLVLPVFSCDFIMKSQLNKNNGKRKPLQPIGNLIDNNLDRTVKRKSPLKQIFTKRSRTVDDKERQRVRNRLRRL